jgi:alpha-tubulin suppressor-like RCC1 family protein
MLILPLWDGSENSSEKQTIRARYTRFLGLGFVGAAFCLGLLLPQSALAIQTGPVFSVYATNGTTTISSGAAASTANGTDFGVCTFGRAYTNTLYVKNSFDSTPISINSWSTNGPGFTISGLPTFVMGANVPFTVIYCPPPSGSNRVSLVINTTIMSGYTFNPLTMGNLYTINLSGSSPLVTAPTISSQPVSKVVAIGQVASLSVTNSGTAPFGYQWLKDGVILAGQTNSTLTYDSFAFADSGSYSVVITNAQGMAISLPANLSTPNAPLRTWGNNGSGQLGNGSTTETNRPITMASNVVAVAGGQNYSLFVKADGTLWAAGNNSYGQLGNGTTNNSLTPIVVASNVVAAAAGYDHALFVKADGTLWSMGNNNYGQLGNGTSSNTNLPVQVASNVVAAAGGAYYSIFVKADGTLWAMGYNSDGQLGIGSSDFSTHSLPSLVASNVVEAVVGVTHTLFVKADGTLWTMGYNLQGQLGNGTTASANLPVRVASNVVAAAGGAIHSLFVKADGTLWAMGGNNKGQLGNGTKINTGTNPPIQVASNVVVATSGYWHSLFVKEDGTLWTMGSNIYGQLGNGNKTDTNWPVRVTGLLVAGLAKEPGASHSLAIAGALPGVSVSNRMVAVGQTTNFMALVTAGDGPFAYQWQFSGTNIVNATNDSYAIASAALSDAGSYAVIVVGTYGTATSSVATLTVNKANQTITFPAIGNKFTTDTVGLSATASSGLPVSFSVLSGLASLSGGTNLTFSAVGSVRIVASQAGDSSYNAAPNVTNTFNVEAPIPPAITVQPVSAVVTNGQAVSLSVSNNGTGPFGYQWLKDGAILSSQTNSTLSFSVFKFTDSGNYSLVITNAQGLAISIPASLSVTNALLLAWGNNGYGQFGSGTTASTNRPITIDSNVVAMASGCWHSLFVKAAGTLLATGYNGQGQLGNGTTAETTLPVQVTNNVVAVAAGRRHSLFVTTDGTLLAMGYNSNGQLGNGTTGVDVIRPIVVASNVVAVAAGEVHSLFVKADGTLWAMGFNNSGQLGNGTTGDTNRPVQVANNVVSVAAGSRYSLFVKADGTLWGMGQNFDGQLGNGMTVNTNRPVQVASQVVAMAAGNQHSLFEKADGTLWAMGANYAGQLGVNTCLTTNQPMLVANNVRAVACGGWHSLFVKANGTLWATGANSDGQLGDDTTTPSTVPVLVNGGSLLAVALAKGSEAFHSLAIAEFQAFSLQVRGTNGAVIASDAVVSAAKGTRFAPILSGGAVTNTFSITNNGTALLAISGAGIQGAGFRVQGIPATVAVGAVSNFTVVFNPDAVGDFTSVLSITNDSPTAVYTVNLAGSCYQLSVNRGPYIGGNTITITNGTFGTITNVLVGGVYANITGSGTTWFTITLPATGSAGTKDIVVQTSNNGDITLPGAYTVNPAGVIGLPAGPSVWTNLSSGMNSAALRSLCASTNGDLYALGYFTTAGGISANNISKWNGNTWTNLGAGIDLLPYDWAAMAIGSNGDLYAGGYFTNAGGHAANYVAKWDGSTWTNLGTGMSGRVFALATGSNGDLYAGGSFITAGGTAARYIAKWNGNSWTNLGAGMNDSVRSLSVAPNGDLYAGGGFTTAGGTTVNGIAKWNGSSWTNLGADMDNPAHALSVAPNGDLYAGGDFTTAGGTVANFIAKWNGSTWTNLGSGMNGSVQSLSVAPNGDVYAGGSFTTAGGATVNRIAKWSGSSWTNLSTGVNDIVYGLAQAPNGGVYAAGNFWMAGSLPVNGVAQWGSPIISATGVEPSNGIFAGGYPVTITGTNLCNGILGDVTNVTLYGVTATVTAVNGSTQVVVTAGVAGVTGLGDVRVCSISFGETVKNNAFEYMRAVQAPLVFSPATPQTFGTTNALSVSGGSGTGVVSYAVLSGPGFIFGGTNLVVTNGVGIIQVEALKAQDGLYFVTSVTSGVTAAKAGQTITFPTIADQLTTNRVVLEATATSGLVPAFTVVSGSASISEGTNLTFTGAGSVSVVATQVGDGNWDPAVSVTNTFMVSLTAQAVLSFNPASPQTYATTNVLSASGGSGVGIVSYVVYSGPGTIFGNDSFRSSGVTGSYRPPTGAKLVVNSGTGTVLSWPPKLRVRCTLRNRSLASWSAPRRPHRWN